MFFPRSVRRIRFARGAFLLAGLAPFCGLAIWAVHRQSDAHRDAIRRDWEQAVGLPIAVASVEHPLPGVVRARGCALATADGRPVLDLASVEVETTATEVRLGVGAIACDPAAAAALAGLAAEWLERGARFRRDVVIDVADFAWQVPDAAGRPERRPVGAVRIECVAKAGDRAVRFVRRAGDESRDEVRIVRADDGTTGGRVNVEASWGDPLPFPILAAVVGRGPVAGLPFGGTAAVRGDLDALLVDGRWSGAATGTVENIDLASCAAPLAARATGTMNAVVRRLEWRDGRLAAAEFACDASAGRIDRRLLDALVATVGCRAGSAYYGAVADRDPAFEALGCTLRIDARGIEVVGSPHLGGAIAVVDGRPLLEAPPGVVSAERVLWLVAPPGAVPVPSSGAGAWLMSVLPSAGGAVERTSRVGAESNGGF